MPDDTQKTLLKIEGDAEGAKRAAEETKRAVTDVGQATRGMAGATTEATKATEAASEASGEATAASERAAKATADLGKGCAVGTEQANAFAEALSTVSPELGLITRLAIRAKEVFAFMFSPIGLAAGAAVGALALVIKSLNDATEAAQRFRQAQDRIKQESIALETAIAIEMGKLGRGGEEPLRKSIALARQKEAAGFEPAAVRQVVPAAVTERGELAVSDEELDRLIAAAQAGHITLGGETRAAQERALQAALRKIRKRPEHYATAAKMFTRPRAELRRRAGNLDPVAIRQYLQEVERLQDEELERATKDIATVGGGAEIEPEGYGGYGAYDWAIEHSAIAEAAGMMSPTEVREEVARRRLMAMRRWAARGREEAPAQAAVRAGPPAPIPPGVGLFGVGEEPAAQAAPVQVHNHGVMMFGRDTRFNRVQRVTNP